MINFPNAKINLGLNIISKRPDGFHDLETVFYPVKWEDGLEILESEETKFTTSGITIPGAPQDNLCLKAYDLVKRDHDLPPVHIHLHKNIPIGAGLGGGSSDAANTLVVLNDHFDLKIPQEQLENYARKLGSDCAFFIRNKPVLAKGKGDQFSPIDISLKEKVIWLIYPDLHISTKEAYAGIFPQRPQFDLTEVIATPIEQWQHRLQNDFEHSLFPRYPVLKELKEMLLTAGALYAAMSGSGSTIFGIFETDMEVTQIKDLPDNYRKIKVIAEI